MTSFCDAETDQSHLLPSSSSRETYGEFAANASERKKLEDSSFSESTENNLDIQRSRKRCDINDDKVSTAERGEKERNREETELDPSEVFTSDKKSNRKHEYITHSSKNDASSGESTPRKRSRKSSSLSPSRQRKHKHKKRREHSRSRSRERRDRDRTSRKESHSKSDRTSSTGNRSKKRSESPRKRKRDRRSRSIEKEGKRSPDRSPTEKKKYNDERYNSYREEDERKSPDRGYNRDDSHRGSSSSSRFKIPKKKREPEEDRIQGSRGREEPAPKVQKISSNLLREIESLLRTEHHHIISKKDRNNSLVPHVEWCYYYLDPKIPGHITGGRAHLHHFCRVCKRTCLHLLGKYGTGKRQCLVCAADEMGWGEDEVPSWYFHDTCEHCKNDFKRQSGGGGYGRGGGYRSGGWQGRRW